MTISGRPATDADRAQFEQVYAATAPRVRAYVRRHVRAADVDEVVADTYVVAWRRRDDLPAHAQLAWLLVTARHLIANRRRRRSETEVSGVDLDVVAAAHAPADALVCDRSVALAALAALTDVEREAVLLVAWDGLDHAAAAAVADCSVRAFTVRLQRARQRLSRLLLAPGDAAVDPPPRVRAVPPHPVPQELL